MRKRLLSFVLGALLVLAQQGAMLHEIGHLRRALQSGSASQHDDAHHKAADKLCETCLAYSALAAFASPAAMPVVLAAAQHSPPKADDVPSLAADAPAPRSRGPPLSL
jgi:hypothetical protein